MTKLDINNLGEKDIGDFAERCEQENGDLEKAFAECWKDHCGRRYGMDGLQQLFVHQRPGWLGEWISHRITAAERFVVATVIQWLGTNCGFSFLRQALRKCNLTIVEVEDRSREVTEPPQAKEENPFLRKL